MSERLIDSLLVFVELCNQATEHWLRLVPDRLEHMLAFQLVTQYMDARTIRNSGLFRLLQALFGSRQQFVNIAHYIASILVLPSTKTSKILSDKNCKVQRQRVLQFLFSPHYCHRQAST